MVRKSHKSIKLRKQFNLKGILLLFFIVASLFSIYLINFDKEVYLPIEKDQIILDQNLILSSQGEEIFRLIYGADSGPTNLDPQNSLNSDSFDVINQVCEGLYTYNLSDPSFSIIPNLALSKGTWLINSTDSWYTISLRSDVSFHDGSKFNATAVKFTFDRLAYLINNSMAMASFLYEYYDPDVDIVKLIIKQTVIIDEYTVRFELNKLYGPFEALLCFPSSYILSPMSTPQYDLIDTVTGDLVGTGPFVFDHYISDDEVLFHAYDDYWAGRANITILKFDIISETYTAYDKTYSFNTLNEANDGSWEYWNTDIGYHSVADRGTYQYWCWTDSGTPSDPTGPPSGISCIYPETSSPTEVGDVYIATLSDTEAIDTRLHGIYVTFDTCMQGDPAGHMYFEYWDGDSWEIRDDWAGDSITTFTARGPYDFTALENDDLKIRFRVVVGGTNFYNDFAFDEVKIYGYLKDVDPKNLALIAGDVDIITDPQPSMFPTLNADPDITLQDAGHSSVTEYLSMNTKKINSTYRKAISYAINYSHIINTLCESPADRLMSPLLEDLLFANWSLDTATFNITKARGIMQSMGFGTGWDTTFPGTSEVNWSSITFATFNYSYDTGNTFRENLLFLLQDNLDKIGIEITDAGVSSSEFYDIFYQRSGYTWDMWELVWLGFYSDYNDPASALNFLFSNRSSLFNTAFYDGYQAAIESGRNPYDLWDNAQLLIENASFETNQTIREAYYDRIQQILVEEDIPWAYGIVSHRYDAFRSHIIGFQSNPLGKLSFYGVTQNSSLAPQTIHLDGNREWLYFRSANKCTGQGTISNPYVIEDLVIDSEVLGQCITIENSDIYFNIENCTLYNGGVQLVNVSNGQLIENTANDNEQIGISLMHSNFNNVTGNNVNNNIRGGIELINSSNNLILGNFAMTNDDFGINIEYGENNLIEGNLVSNNDYGIYIQYSNNNNISSNTVLNNNFDGIHLVFSDGNDIIGNNASNNDIGFILYSDSKFNKIEGNFAWDNNIGIYFGTDSDNNTIEANRVEYSSSTGIYLFYSDDNYVLVNNVSNNVGWGIISDYGSFNRFLDNLISDNSLGGLFLTNCFDSVIRNNTLEANYQAGIYLDYSDRNQILNNRLRNNLDIGIYLYYSDINDFTDNIISNNADEGIYLYYSHYNDIVSNDISNNHRGIYINGGDYNLIEDNTVYDNNGPGIYLSSGNYYNSILDNNLNNNFDYGIYMIYGYSNIITGNIISGNSLTGIYLYESDNIDIINNFISQNIDRGIYLGRSNLNTVVGNTIQFHNFGIYVYYSSNNQISNNIFNNNGVDIEEIVAPKPQFPTVITAIVVVLVVIIVIIIVSAVIASRRRMPSVPKYTKPRYQYAQKVEKKEYMNPDWLKAQYYDQKKTLYQIAQDQNTSIYTIRKWLDKLEEPRVMEKEQKETKFCTKCGQELPIKANFCIKCGETTLESEQEEKISEDQQPMFPPISDLVQKPEELEPQEELVIPPEEETLPEPLILIEEKEIAEIEISRAEVEELEPIPLVPPEEEKVPIQEEDIKEMIEEPQPLEPIPEKPEEPPIEEIPEPIIEEAPPSPVESPKKIPIFCKFCGMKLNKTAKFCPQCGTIVKNS